MAQGVENSYSEFVEFMTEFKQGTVRAAMILGVARLDLLLYQLLAKFLLPSVSSYNDLFDGDAPLSTF